MDLSGSMDNRCQGTFPRDADAVELWLAFAADLDPDARAACGALLDADERRTWERLRLPADRDAYVVAHALLRQALSRRLPLPPPADASRRPSTASRSSWGGLGRSSA